MQSNKNGKIWVYSKSPFENSYSNTIKFNTTEEIDYFFENSNLLELIYYSDSYSQIRKTGNIQIKGRIDKYENASYMRFQNRGKMFYAFIIDTRYTNENVTEVFFEIDVWNTYHLELFKNKIHGFVEQATEKNKQKDGSLNIINTQQGFNIGTKQTAYIMPLKLADLEWLVIVAKPTIKINENDERVNQSSFPASFKSFRYFVVPVNLQNGMTYPFVYNGVKIKQSSIYTILRNFTNTFNNDVNTVNQIVNVYTTKYCGIDYRIEDNEVIIGHISDGILQGIGGFGVGLDNNSTTNSGITSGNIDNIIEWNKNLIFNNRTLTEEMIKRLILWCRAFKVLPEMVIVQMYHESLWGDSPVALSNNNWSGITAWWTNGTEYNTTVDITMQIGTPRPISEGGNYIYFNSTEDWLAYHMYLISGYPANSGEKRYKTSGVTDFELSIKGLFKEGGAKTDYASAGMVNYLNACKNIQKNMRAIFGSDLDEINNLVYKNNKWLDSNPIKNNIGLEYLESKLGESLGNKECYAVAGAYVVAHGAPVYAPVVGGGVYPNNETDGERLDIIPNVDLACAENIGIGFNWAKFGWIVENDPITIDNLRVGDIICWYGGFTDSPYASSKRYGHVGVCYDVDYVNNTVSYYEQWNGVNLKKTSNIKWQSKYCKSIIHTPNSYYKNGSYNGNINGVNNNNPTMIEIIRLMQLEPLEKPIKNLKSLLNEAIKKQLNLENVESQIFSSEFCNFKLFDGYSSFYNFLPEFIPDGENKIIISGCVSDTNHIHYTIDGYNSNDVLKSDDSMIIGGHAIFLNRFKYGLSDSNPRSLTILSDSTETFMQANKNQYESQQKSFNENADLLSRQIDYSNRNVDLMNRQATYNANYAVENAKINLAQTSFNALTGIIGSATSGDISGTISNTVNGGFGVVNSMRSLQNANMQENFTHDNNSMRSQYNSLSNMQAKLSLTQNIRSYNSSLKDLDNQPVSIQQLGVDLSFQIGNNFDDLYIAVEIPNKFQLENANKYLKYYGVILNTWCNDIREYTEKRKNFNYLKCTNIELKNIAINQAHLNALKSVFITGVRIWNYCIEIDEKYLDMDSNNDDL